MKLNTLLLTSAATLMATSVAFAADLPSKKAAPAAGSVQVCKVGGMTGMTLASGVCLGIDGRVTVDVGNLYDNDFFGNDSETGGNNSGAAHGVDGGVGFRLNFDARQNSELGLVRGYVSLTSGTDQDHVNRAPADTEATEAGKATFRKAFIQIGGFTTGLKDSIADIAGTQGNIFTSGWSQAGVGMDYQVNVGGANLGIGIEDSQKALANGYPSDRPDLILHLSGKAAGLGYALAAVSHDANGDNGYALLGSVNMNLSNVTLFAFAGMAEQANTYVGGSSDWLNGPSLTVTSGDEATSFGGGLTFALSSATSLTVQGVNFQDNDDDVTSAGIYLSHALAKGLTIQPEVVWTDDGATDLTSYYLRIQRDF